MTEETPKRPPASAWPEYGSPAECYRCKGAPWYRVQDFTFPTNPVRRYLCQTCFKDWCHEQRPGEGGQYRYTFRPLFELRGLHQMEEPV